MYGLVDELNKKRSGFGFPKDMALKASLMLADLPDVGFKVKNFDAENMRTIEKRWDQIAKALGLATRLLADFGFSDRNLTANNVIIPIAYYLMKRRANPSYLTATSEGDDRERVRLWAVRSLVKAGVWGSGLDSLLRSIREVVRSEVEVSGNKVFPLERIESAMVPIGKSLRFDEEEIDSLLEARYGRKGTFSILSLLYPGKDLQNEFHVDHVFPQSLFRKKKLLKTGVPEEKIDAYKAMMDSLPNLQLLLGPLNQEKSDNMPHDWVTKYMPDATERGFYLAKHDLIEIPKSMTGFESFFDARRSRMRERLKRILQVPLAQP